MKRRLLFILPLAVAVITVGLLTFGQSSASADNNPISTPGNESLKYIDATTLHLKVSFSSTQGNGNYQNHKLSYSFDDNFVNPGIFTANRQYTTVKNGCTSQIQINPGLGDADATVILGVKDPANPNSCNGVIYHSKVNGSSLSAGHTAFNWTGSASIDAIQGGYTLSQSSPSVYSGVVNQQLLGIDECGTIDPGCTTQCAVVLTMTSNNKQGKVNISCGGNGGIGACLPGSGGCTDSNTFNVEVVGSPTAPVTPGTGSGGGTGTTQPGGGQAPGLTCLAGSEPSLDWVLCPVTRLLKTVIEGVDKLITDLLVVGNNGSSDNPNQIFADNGKCGNSNNVCDAYYKAWRSFRNIALGLLVIAGLVVVTSQALGMEILSAYTIRQVLPRILTAAILTTLSWQLMRFFVILTNDLGFGVSNLIQAPFADSGLKDQIHFTMAGQGLSGILAFGAFALLGVFGLFLIFVSGALAVFVAILVLILRQIAIIILIIVAPIALVAYILPNTQKIYKIWLDSFMLGLMMFPIIVAFITAGRVFSTIAANSSSGFSSDINQFIAFAAYFAPYFLIPATFKFAGGAIRGIGGFVHGQGQGAFGSLRQARNKRMGQNLTKIRSGQNRWNKDFGRFGKKEWMSVGHLANRAAVNMFDQDELAPARIGKTRYGKYIAGRKSAGLFSEIDAATVDQSTKGLQELEKRGFGREAYKGMAAQYNEFKGRVQGGKHDGKLVSEVLGSKFGTRHATSLADWEFMSGVMQRSSDTKEAEGGKDIFDSRGYLANIKNDPEMPYADTQAIGLLGAAAAGYDGHATRFAETGNSLAKRLGGGGSLVMGQAQKYARQSRPDLRDRYGLVAVPNPDGKGGMVYESAYEKPFSKAATGSIITLKGTDWTQAKGEAVLETAETYKGIVTGAAAQHYVDEAERLEAAGDTAGAQAAYKYAEDMLDQQENIKNVISYGAANFYSDPGAQREWQKIAAEVLSEDERGRGARLVADEQARRMREGGPDAGASPGGAPGAGPGAPGPSPT